MFISMAVYAMLAVKERKGGTKRLMGGSLSFQVVESAALV